MRAVCVTLAVVLMLAAPSCKKKEQPPKKPKREDVMRDASSERRSVLAFVDGLKQVIEMQDAGGEPSASRMAAISARLEAVPRGGLPDNLGRAWQRVLKVFRRGAGGENSAEFQADGQAASDELNAALRANGIIDFRF